MRLIVDEGVRAFLALELQARMEPIHANMVEAEFWSKDGADRPFAEIAALIHTEISEAAVGFPGFGRSAPRDKHLPDCLSIEVELMDGVIRALDVMGHWHQRTPWNMQDYVERDNGLFQEVDKILAPGGIDKAQMDEFVAKEAHGQDPDPVGPSFAHLLYLHALVSDAVERDRKHSGLRPALSEYCFQSFAILHEQEKNYMNRLLHVLDAKVEYNKSRPKKHGKRY